MSPAEDHYRVLGVPRTADMPEIRRAYRRLARQHHPDRNPGPDGPRSFRALAEAYQVLGDPARRARYDQTIQPPALPNVPRSAAAVVARRGVLELTPREAFLAVTTSLTLTTKSGLAIVLPAGVTEGARITFIAPDGWVVLTVHVNPNEKT
jgi:curved DNA-binding protein CbpA